MKKTISKVPFKGTKDQEQKLIEIIEKYKDAPGSLLPILQEAQGIYGYLPIEVQETIAEKLGISVEEIYGVTTFYTQFALMPKGEHNISICLGTACYVRGAQDVLDKVMDSLNLKPEECTEDGKFSLTACRCVGACGLAPILMVDDDVYGNVKEEEIDDIINKYKNK